MRPSDAITYNRVVYAFGTWNAAIAAAGFSTRRQGQHFRGQPSLPRHFASEDEELAYLIAEQEKDMRLGDRSYAVDPLASKYKRNLVVTDAWTHAVHALVDFRRLIDRWSER